MAPGSIVAPHALAAPWGMAPGEGTRPGAWYSAGLKRASHTPTSPWAWRLDLKVLPCGGRLAALLAWLSRWVGAGFVAGLGLAGGGVLDLQDRLDEGPVSGGAGGLLGDTLIFAMQGRFVVEHPSR